MQHVQHSQIRGLYSSSVFHANLLFATRCRRFCFAPAILSDSNVGCRYVTANLTKLVVLVNTSAKPPTTHRFNEDMILFFQQFERAFKHAASNPFHTAGTVRSRAVQAFRHPPPWTNHQLGGPSLHRVRLFGVVQHLCEPGTYNPSKQRCQLSDAVFFFLDKQTLTLSSSCGVLLELKQCVQMIESPKFTEKVLAIVAGSFRGAAAQQATLETSALR